MKELALKKLEAKLKEKALIASYKNDFRKEQILKYSEFFGSLQLVLGYLGDIVDNYQRKYEPNERKKLIAEIVDHPHYEEAIKNLNLEMSWISIVTDSNEVFESLHQLEKEFDEFMGLLGKHKKDEITDNDITKIIDSYEQVKESKKSLIKLLQEEIKHSI